MEGIVDFVEWLITAPFVCLGWIIVGFIAGAAARFITRSPDRPFWSDILLGLAGAFVGGFLVGLFSVDTGTEAGFSQLIMTTIVAIIGAVVLIFIGRAIRRA